MASSEPSALTDPAAGRAATGRAAAGRAAADRGERQATVVAVMPVHNGDRVIGSALLKLKQFVNAAVVVNDGSSDATGTVARQAGAEVIEYLTRQAPGVALEHGLARALDLGADVVVILEGEAQLYPEQVPLVTEPILQGGADMVIGVPLKQVHRPRSLRLLTGKMLRATMPERVSSLRAFTAPALAASGVFGAGFLGDRKVKAASAGHGLRALEVAISQGNGEKKNDAAGPRVRTDLLFRLLTLDSAVRLLIALGLAGLILNIVGIYFWYQTVQIFTNSNQLALGHALLGTLAILVGVMVSFEALTLNILRRLVARGGGPKNH